MAITFLQEKKRQKYLILLLALVIFCILFIVLKGFFKGTGTTPSIYVPPSLIPQEIKIDWAVLDSSQLKELEVFETISPLSGEVGRENPFVPY